MDAGVLVRDHLARLGNDCARVWVIAAGKASIAMAHSASVTLGEHVAGGLVVAPERPQVPLPFETIVGEHPQPGAGSEAAARRALAIAAAVPPDALLLVLISGGASSLLALPADGLTLDDKRAATGVLLRSGADIHALNTVRKHLSAIKGGRLAAACAARTVAMVLSDVVGDDLSVIASGPTVADPSTYSDAFTVIDRFGGRDAYPPAVVAHVIAGSRGERPESPKPGAARLERAETTLVGGRRHAMEGAAAEARARGYATTVVDDAIVGEARLAGPRFVSEALRLASTMTRPACVIASGETTVRVLGNGRGGRNQELVLSAFDSLQASGRACALASVGTDGIDGPTDAAGAVADSHSAARAASNSPGWDTSALANNDAYPLMDRLGDLIRTGPTGTNVGDLQVFLLA